MNSRVRFIGSTLAIIALIAVGWTVLSSGNEAAAGPGGGPPGGGCCDPADEPGVGSNPFCFEGHTCCASGNWQCNNEDASPSCDPGEVCDGSCGDKNDPCDSDDDCCSGVCKPNGRCK